jgi:hypothetical protein
MQTVDAKDKIIVPKLSEVPEGLQKMYNDLYAKIDLMIVAGPNMSDSSRFLVVSNIVRICLQCVMVAVESYRTDKNEILAGAQKRQIALALIKYILNDLAVRGKIPRDIADEVILQIDLWGGLAMDLACDAAKRVIDIGQEFVADAKAEGCSSACKQNCCVIC